MEQTFLSAASAFVLSFGLLTVTTAAAVTVGPPNLLWHNSLTGENRVWTMNGVTFQTSTPLQSNTDDANWKNVGTADFDGDGIADIVWQHNTFGWLALWHMNSDGTVKSTAGLQTPSPGWQLVGVADFDNDGHPDLLFENYSAPIHQHVIWIMNGAAQTTSLPLSQETGDAQWKASCAAVLPGTPPKPVIVWRHQTLGDVALWYMSGATQTGVASFTQNGAAKFCLDEDYQPVGLWNANGDQQPDLIWHHVTAKINMVWFLNGTTVQTQDYFHQLSPLAPDWFDPVWKIAGQPWTSSKWRLNFEYGTPLSATVSSAPAQINLTAYVPFAVGDAMTVSRRTPPATAWSAIGTVSSTNYTDTTVSIGQVYEYQVNFTSGGTHRPAYTKAAIARPPTALEDRGSIIVLIENSLSNKDALFSQIQADLVADGWTVVRFNAPTHNTSNASNYITDLLTIKQFIGQQSAAKGILIVGHVTIPYSGVSAADGHTAVTTPPDHSGAWPADMYYGDLDGSWTDTQVNIAMSGSPANVNVKGDGKFDQDTFPSKVELFVGRVDFAGLSSIPNPEPVLKRYFDKTHSYRYALGQPYQNRAIVYDDFRFEFARVKPWGIGPPPPVPTECIYENALRNSAALFGNPTSSLDVGDALYQKSTSYLWGFLAGPGQANRIADSWPSPANPFLQHTSSDLASNTWEPKVGFFTLLGSYFGDWNMPDDFMRSTLASANFGLAATWIGEKIVQWEFHGLALGETLGEAALATVNMPLETADNERWVTIMGDPTLRINVIAPPTALDAKISGANAILNWSAGHSSQYHIYRAASTNGPFTRVTTTPVPGFTTTTPHDSALPAYMVRGVETQVTGSGSYANLSQGAIAVAHP